MRPKDRWQTSCLNHIWVTGAGDWIPEKDQTSDWIVNFPGLKIYLCKERLSRFKIGVGIHAWINYRSTHFARLAHELFIRKTKV